MAGYTVTNQVDKDTYRRLFEDNADGVAVLDELVSRFGSNPYTPGGVEAARATDFKAGRLDVVQFILRKINHANGVKDNVQENTEIDE